MKIVTIVGARPQFIKAAAVRRAIQKINESAGSTVREERIQEILVHTGQHYDYMMDKVFFEELKLPKPDYHLGVGSGSHAKQTGKMLERIETVLQKERPESGHGLWRYEFDIGRRFGCSKTKNSCRSCGGRFEKLQSSDA